MAGSEVRGQLTAQPEWLELPPRFSDSLFSFASISLVGTLLFALSTSASAFLELIPVFAENLP